MGTHPSPKARAQAVARIRSGDSTPTLEAQRLSTHKRTVEKWVAAVDELEKAEEKAVPQSTVPSGERPESTRNEALDEALKAAGESPEGPKPGVPTAEDVQTAKLDIQGECLKMIGDMKQGVGSILVQFRYDPPLKITDRRVQEKLQLGPLASGAIRANAAALYPMLTGMLSGRFQLFAALGLEALLLLVGLEKLAKEDGWQAAAKDAPKAPAGMRAAVGGSPADLAAHIERSRKEQVPQDMGGGLPKTDAPSGGNTINAPAA